MFKMNIKLSIKKTTAYFLITSALTFVYIMLVLAFELVYFSIWGSYSFLAAALWALLFAITFTPLREILQKIIDRVFFRRTIEHQKIIKEVAQLISTVTDLNTIFRLIDHTIVRAMSASNLAVLLLEERENCFRVEKTSKDISMIEQKLPLNSPLAACLQSNKDAVLLEDIRSKSMSGKTSPEDKVKLQKVLSEMEIFRAAAAIPSFTRGKLVGIICLGEKLSGERYSQDDLELLNTMASEAGIAIENAKLYRDITETRDYLNSLVEGSNDAILTMNPDGVILSWNKGAENIFGYSSRETVGKIPNIFTEAEIRGLINKVLNGEAINALELQKKNKAGMELPLLLTLSPILDHDGKTIGISAILKDITELRKVDQLKQELLTAVSQELHTPLKPIRESIALVLNDQLEKLPPKQREALSAALSQSDHLDNLIDGLIDISRIEAGKPLQIKRAPIYMDELMKESIENYKTAFQSKSIAINLDYSAERVAVMADKNKLLRVMDNILENSRKFTPRGGAVKVSIIIEENQLKISIADTGMGLATEHLEKIFEKFYQVDISYVQDCGGIGMGLTISREIVEAHGGRIWAESAGVGKGATFIFTLPLTA